MTKDHVTLVPKIIVKKRSHIVSAFILFAVLFGVPACVGALQYAFCEKEGFRECVLPEYMPKD